MIFRNLDAEGDWTFGQGLADYVGGQQAIGLNIKTRLLSWLGDCFFSLESGIDWVNRLGSKNQRALLELDLRRMILQSFGVVGIASFSSTLINRRFVADYSVDTIYTKTYTDRVSQGI